MLQPGICGHAELCVTTADTARALGSGELPVLATPAVAALIEKACWQAVAPELEPGKGTVGTRLALAHTAPTPVGMTVWRDCTLTAVDGRRLTFTARVYDDVSEVAHATHERYIVDNDRFTHKASAKLNAD